MLYRSGAQNKIECDKECRAGNVMKNIGQGMELGEDIGGLRGWYYESGREW